MIRSTHGRRPAVSRRRRPSRWRPPRRCRWRRAARPPRRAGTPSGRPSTGRATPRSPPAVGWWSTTRPLRMIVTTSVAWSTSASLWLTSTDRLEVAGDDLAHRGEEPLALLRRQHRRRLVEHDHPRLAPQALEQLDPLAVARPTGQRHRVGIEGEPVVLADLGDEVARPAPVEPLVVPEHDVLPDGQRLDEAEVLVHHADAEGGRGLRIGDRRGTPSSSTRPSSGWTRPISTFISVDLPAPFSPSTPCTSPARKTRSTPSHATTAPYRLVTCCSSTTLVVADHRVRLRYPPAYASALICPNCSAKSPAAIWL